MIMDDDPSPRDEGPQASVYTIGTGGTLTGIGSYGGSHMAARYWPNMETFHGELFVKPPITSKRFEERIGRNAAVKLARSLERTNEHMRGGTDKKTNMVVGATLRVMPQPNWKLLAAAAPAAGIDRKWAMDFAAQCYQQFNDWGYDQRVLCDAEGHYNFGGMMWQAYRGLEGPDAETVGVIHYDQQRADDYNHRWATYVTLIDPDRVQTPPEKSFDIDAVWEGRELDVNGRMTALYVTVRHPSEGGVEAVQYVRCPRENNMGRPMAWQWFKKNRPGAQRGMTNWLTILRGAGMFDNLDDAMLGNATKAAMFATYIKTAADKETVAETLAPAEEGRETYLDSKMGFYEKAKIRLGNQRLVALPPEDEIAISAIDHVISDASGFRNGFLRAFASAIGISFEQISNNFSEANYSSARAALLEIWRGILVDRTFFTSHVASLIYAAVIEEAIGKGWIKLPAGAPDFYQYRAAYVNCGWTGPGMGWIDPQKEAAAQAIRIDNKTTTRQKEIAEQGGDWTEVFEQIHEEDEMADELDIDLTPSATTLRNTANPPLAGGDNPPDDPANDNPDQPPAKQKIKRGSATSGA